MGLDKTSGMDLDKTSGFGASSPSFTVKCKVCCLAKQQCSATASWTILVKYIQPEEPLSTGKFTLRNTRAIDCSYKATRLAAWEPLVIWEFLLKHRRGPGCSLPATPVVHPSWCSAWAEAVDIAPGSPVAVASRCAASSAVRASLEQALRFLACSRMWQGEDTNKLLAHYLTKSEVKWLSGQLGSASCSASTHPGSAGLLYAWLTSGCSACLGSPHFSVFSEISSLNCELPSSEGHDTFQQP